MAWDNKKPKESLVKSKSLLDYVEAKLTDLKPGVAFPTNVFLYMISTRHLFLWRTVGSTITSEELENLKNRGLNRIWIYKTEWPKYWRYLHPLDTTPDPEFVRISADQISYQELRLKKKEATPLSQELVYKAKPKPKELLDTIRSESQAERAKRAVVAKLSRSFLGDLAAATTDEEQRRSNTSVSNFVRDLLSEVAPESRAFTAQIWELASMDASLNHGISVATMSVLFAMSFGKIDESLLADIGMAGLLHDVGMTQLPYQLSQYPWQIFTAEQMDEYLTHASHSAEVISSLAPMIPLRVKSIIKNHHNNFLDPDKATPATEIGQFVAMADMLDDMCSGHWDGKKRTLITAIAELEILESEPKNRKFVPVVFEALVRWVRGEVPPEVGPNPNETITIIDGQIKAVPIRKKAS